MQAGVIAHAPPDEFRAVSFERGPRGDIGLMVEVCDNDFAAVGETLANRQTDDANERGCVHAKTDLACVAGIQEDGYALPGASYRGVHLLAFSVAAAALYVALE